VVQNLGRMIIYTTDLTLLAENLSAFPNQVGTIAVTHGGYIAGIEMKDENGIPSVLVQLKVPPARYEETMQSLRALAIEVRDEKASTKDVTEEHSDVETQLASLEATHARLLEIMNRATTVDEVLKVQQQASQVKLQIDRLKGRETALERLSEFATVSARALLASAALQRDYTAVRSAYRRAEANRVSLENQLRRVRTPEEEAAIRDRLGEAMVELQRLQVRLSEVEAKATAIRVPLPSSDAVAGGSSLAETLPREYIDTRVALRRAEHEQALLTQQLQSDATDVDPNRLSEAILRVNQLNAQLKQVQERATQSGTSLPALTAEQVAALSGVPLTSTGISLPGPLVRAWDSFVLGAASMLLFAWWLAPVGLVLWLWLRRRSPRPAATSTL
jgi:hypothetical protein